MPAPGGSDTDGDESGPGILRGVIAAMLVSGQEPQRYLAAKGRGRQSGGLPMQQLLVARMHQSRGWDPDLRGDLLGQESRKARLASAIARLCACRGGSRGDRSRQRSQSRVHPQATSSGANLRKQAEHAKLAKDFLSGLDADAAAAEDLARGSSSPSDGAVRADGLIVEPSGRIRRSHTQ